MRNRTHPDMECPADGCRQRFLSDDGIGRHLEMIHGAGTKWRDESRPETVMFELQGRMTLYETPSAWMESECWLSTEAVR